MAKHSDFETSSNPPIFKEQQRFQQWWLWVLVLGCTVLAWWAFIQQILADRPFGQNPAPDWAVVLLWIVIGFDLPFFFGILKLVVEVRSGQVFIHFRPLSRRTIPTSDILSVEVRRYNALVEYGGWGIKGWSRRKMAYNVRGDRGVDLTLRDGRRILIGSQRPEELAAAIESQRSGVAGRG